MLVQLKIGITIVSPRKLHTVPNMIGIYQYLASDFLDVVLWCIATTKAVSPKKPRFGMEICQLLTQAIHGGACDPYDNYVFFNLKRKNYKSDQPAFRRLRPFWLPHPQKMLR